MPFIVDNEFGAELSQNYVLLKKCKKINGIALISCLVGGIVMIAYSCLSMVGLSWDWFSIAMGKVPFSTIAFILIADSVIVCPLSAYLTYRASMLHHDLAAIIVLAIQLANFIFMIVLESLHIIDRVPVAFLAFAVYSLICLGTGSANFWATIKYHWLEQQRGFPHFSARFEEQKEDKFQRGIMDQFQQEVSRLKKTATDEMSDIGQTNEQLTKYQHEHKPSSMDEI